MSSTAKNTSNKDKTPELEPEDRSQIKLEETAEQLEPGTDQTGETGNLQRTEEDYSSIYRQKNITKKALTALGCMSLAAGSATAASMGIGGALFLDYYGNDETFSLQKAEELYNRAESYKEKVDF